MNSTKILLIAFLLLIADGISCNLLAQEKKVHVKVVTNGKGTDTVYTISSTAGSENIGEENVVIIRNSGGDEEEEEMDEANGDFPVIYSLPSCICKEKCCRNDSCMKKEMHRRIMIQICDSQHTGSKHHKMKYVVRRNGGPMEDAELEMERIPMNSSNDTTIMHVSPRGDTIKIHRKVLKNGKIEQEVTVNKHSKDTIDNKYFTYRIRSDKNHLFLRKMRIPWEDDENFEFIMPPMPPTPPSPTGIEGMNFAFPGMPEGIDENADFGKIKVAPLMGKNLIRVSLDLSGKENTIIKISDEKGKAVFEEKIKDLTGKYVRDIDMTGNAKGKYSLGIERGKSIITRQFIF